MPTTVLVHQTVQTMQNLVPERRVSIFDGSHKDTSGDILITTYTSFRDEENADQFLGRGLVILDEVHYALSGTNIASVNRLKSSSIPPKILGFTATGEFNTYRAEASLSKVDELLPHSFFRYDIVSGLRDGILSPYRIVELDLHNPDLLKALRSKKPQGEETTAQWKERVLESLNNNAINRVFPNLIQTFEEGILQSQTGLIFTVSINHADALSDRLNKVFGEGYASSIHSKTKKAQARDMIEKHKTGEIKILVNVGVLTAGYDNPDLGFIVDFKPTGSQVSLVQAFGRLLRTGKPPVTKTYIQLVVPELDHLKVSDIFAKEHVFPEVSPTTVASEEVSGVNRKRSYGQMYTSVSVSIINGNLYEDDSCGYTLTVPSGEQMRVFMESVDPEEIAQIEDTLQKAIAVIESEWPEEDEKQIKDHEELEKESIKKIIEISKNELAVLHQKKAAAECLSMFPQYRKEAIESWIEVMKHPRYVYQGQDDKVASVILKKYYENNISCRGPYTTKSKVIYDQLILDYERAKNASLARGAI